MRVSSYVIGTDLPGGEFCLLLHGYTGAVDKVSASLGHHLLAARGQEIEELLTRAPGVDVTRLASRGYVTDLDAEAERELLVSIALELHTSDLANTAAGFMFVPAYTCNLRCPYCFQPHEYHRGAGKYGTLLSRELVDAGFSIANKIAAPGDLARHIGLLPSLEDGARRGEPFKKVGLFGGEPLSEGTENIVRYIVAQAAMRGMTVTAITNGVELDRFTDLLSPNGLAELQITLDGTAHTHDRRRVGPGFRETFARICDNIDTALSRGVRLSLRMNVDSVNAAELESLSEFIAGRGWDKTPLFSAHAASVSAAPSHGDTQSRTELVEQTMALRQRQGSVFFSYEKAARETLESCLFGSGYAFKGVANCSAESGLLMFDPLGDVYSCWEEIGDTTNRVATYSSEGIRFEGDRMARWMSRFPGAIDECSRCPYALIHVSGCGKHAVDMSGTMYASACENFKQYFPRTLSLAYEEFEAELQKRPVVFPALPSDQSGNHTRVYPMTEVR